MGNGVPLGFYPASEQEWMLPVKIHYVYKRMRMASQEKSW